jgi:ATP-dependent DNA helicase, RecQ family
MNFTRESLTAVLKEHFKLSDFRRGQREIIECVLNKKDVLAVLPTGGGKSLCYQLPAVATGKLVIVISPLIALMKDQVAGLTRKGIPAGCLHSDQDDLEKRLIFSKIQQGGTFVLYLSPERAQKEGFRNWVKNQDIALFAIDEAHCVSQWGHDFREEYSQLSTLKTLRPDVPILALTASATPTVLADIAKQLQLQTPERMVHGFYRPNLYYQVEFCADEEAKMNLLVQGIKQTPHGRIIVYCGTRRSTEEVAAQLAKRFEGVGFYHAGIGGDQRTLVQNSYISGSLRILVATNAFGMGIDQPDVRLVMHFQMPANIDSLYQEMGRAGRDEAYSTCMMLYSRKDKGLQSYFIDSSEAPEQIKNLRWRNLDALVNYSEGSECRHSEILTYYKDSQRIQNCGHCDSCAPQSERKIKRPLYVTVGPAVKTKKAKKDAFETEVLDEVQERRFQALKGWRKQKATELDVPAFVVFSDQTLRKIAIKNPKQPDDLRGITGIGEVKLEKFGWDVLAELTEV